MHIFLSGYHISKLTPLEKKGTDEVPKVTYFTSPIYTYKFQLKYLLQYLFQAKIFLKNRLEIRRENAEFIRY